MMEDPLPTPRDPMPADEPTIPTPEKAGAASSTEEFLALLTKHDQALTTYVNSLIPSRADAQDVIQETKMALWRSFDSFEPGTNFIAWARKTALHRILKYKRKKGTDGRRLLFTDECYETLTEEYEEFAESHNSLRSRLNDCVAKLPHQHREMIVLRYFKESSISDVATKIDRSVEATYRALSRIRLALRDCLDSPSS